LGNPIKLAETGSFLRDHLARLVVLKSIGKLMAPYNISPSAFASKINPSDRIAFVTSHRLGDALLSMIVVNNLRREGFKVEVFSGVVYELRDWFPGVIVFPFTELRARASCYQHIWYERPNRRVAKIPNPHTDSVIVLKESPFYRLALPMSTVHRLICQYELGISRPVLENGLVIPESAQRIKDSPKIIIHPTSSSRLRSWNLKSFIRLVQLLQDQGFEPEFIVGPQEVKVANRLRKAGMKCFISSDINSVAGKLCTAWRFLGNDSGVGQLASNVGTPTITLFTMTRKAMRWQPCWAPAVAVLPSLSEKFPELLRKIIWKYWITPEMVLAAFGPFNPTHQKQKKDIEIFHVL
jgi:heptosyltransferase III